MPFKKTFNISTVRTTPQMKTKFERTVKTLGFRSMAHFFTRSMETLLEQTDAGQTLVWPLRYEQQKKGESIVKTERKKKFIEPQKRH